MRTWNERTGTSTRTRRGIVSWGSACDTQTHGENRKPREIGRMYRYSTAVDTTSVSVSQSVITRIQTRDDRPSVSDTIKPRNIPREVVYHPTPKRRICDGRYSTSTDCYIRLNRKRTKKTMKEKIHQVLVPVPYALENFPGSSRLTTADDVARMLD